MKNFLDITAIDTSNKLVLDISIKEHNDPCYNFTVNNLPLETRMCFDLLDSLYFNCNIVSGAVEVIKLTINGKEVLPIYQHLARPATNWITTDWELVVPAPFYTWYHEITGQGWTA